MLDDLLYPIGFFAAVSLAPPLSLIPLAILICLVGFGLRQPGAARPWTALALASGFAALTAALFSMKSPLNGTSCLLGYLGWPVPLLLLATDCLWALAGWARGRTTDKGLVWRLILHGYGFVLILRSAAICTV